MQSPWKEGVFELYYFMVHFLSVAKPEMAIK